MSEKVFMNQTELGRVFGKSRVFIGRVLRQMGLREPNGDPIPEAIAAGVAEEREGPQAWISAWVWDAEWLIPRLERRGLRKVVHA